MSLNNIAVTLGRIDREKNLDQQYALVEEALETERELGGLSQIAAMLTNLSFLDIEKKNYQRARVRLRESMHIATSAGIPRYVFWTIRYYAEMLLSQGQLERGLALYGMLRQQTLWTASVETQLQKTLDRYSIQPEDAEAGMAGGTNLDFDETAEEIRADLEGDGN
jgi:hypothetical protein